MLEEKHNLDMEINPGAPVSVIPSSFYTQKLSHRPLKPTTVLRGYGGEAIPLLGQVEVRLKNRNQQCVLPLVVASVEGPPLLGRNWLTALKLPWQEIFQRNIHNVTTSDLESVLGKHEHMLAKPGLGSAIKGFKERMKVKEDAKPVFCRDRPVPYAPRDQVEAELSRLEREGIITKV